MHVQTNATAVRKSVRSSGLNEIWIIQYRKLLDERRSVRRKRRFGLDAVATLWRPFLFSVIGKDRTTVSTFRPCKNRTRLWSLKIIFHFYTHGVGIQITDEFDYKVFEQLETVLLLLSEDHFKESAYWPQNSEVIYIYLG